MLNRPLPAPARDIAMLIARIILGVVLFAHGWQKLMINGIADTYGQFEKLGIPLAIVSASFTSFVEFVGGVLIIMGALTTTVVALDLVVMVGAAGFVHVTHGIFAKDGGWELVGVIVAVELALAAFGPGRYSVDDLVVRRRARERADLERRRQAPVTVAAAVSETFTPAVEPKAGIPTGGFARVAAPATAGVAIGGFAADAPTGAFAVTPRAASAFAAADAPTGAFTAVAPAASGSTGAWALAPAVAGSTAAAGSSNGAVAPAASGSTGAWALAPTVAGSAAAAGSSTGAAATGGGSAAAPAPAGVPVSASAARSSNAVPTGGFAAVTPAAAGDAAAETAVDTPTTDAFAAVGAAPAEQAGVAEAAQPAARRSEPLPRMASAGVHRTLAERAGRPDPDVPAPFGVTVQSPLDFTPTTALPVVSPMSVETDTITVATSVPGGLPRRVRAADLPPASAVRPYA